jgi:squalene-hopene/tetraprenyl-beta-curcumene cyclase
MTIAPSIDPGQAPVARLIAAEVGLEASIARATDALLKAQRPDGHWVFELEADATIPAEYVLLVHWLGEAADPELERKIGVYLRRIQGDSAHNPGGWALFHDGAIDISATVKAYFALKMIGDDVDAPHMVRARTAILARGGAAATNVFTRIQLALFGQLSWNAIPTMPPEIILLPRWFPVHLSRMSYWARTVIVPLLVLQVRKPMAVNARRIGVPELFGPPVAVGAAPHQKRLWAAFFHGLDVVLKAGEGLWPRALRARAIKACVDFTDARLNGEDGLGAIYPAMANSVMMFAALGRTPDDPARAIARRSVEKLLVVKEHEAYCQPCVSPVWDTALAAHALLDVGTPAAETAALAGLDWLLPLQELEVKGDWADRKPDVRPGGWAFQYRNAHYPDLDDTAVVVMALDRAQRGTESFAARRTGDSEAIERGVEWTAGLQSANGGWGAFDADNTDHYLNNIPFADHGALLDPPTVDVSARCISMLAQRGEPADSPRMQAALAYVLKDQLADGSWFGRWGVNYIYGTWSALCALNAAGLDPQSEPMRRAVDWLVSIQNADGGWGEDCDSYRLDYDGHRPAPSIASQTGWALLGLMAAGEADNPAVARGIAWLQATLGEDGEWPEEHYTGGGFPRVFYLRYHGYRRYFPLWALARYRNLKASNSGKVPFGM